MIDVHPSRFSDIRYSVIHRQLFLVPDAIPVAAPGRESPLTLALTVGFHGRYFYQLIKNKNGQSDLHSSMWIQVWKHVERNRDSCFSCSKSPAAIYVILFL